MTTELEEQFFETFEIPKICQEGRTICKQYNRSCDKCCYLQYPQINDSIYLELVAILNMNTSQRLYIEDVEDLKVQTLKGLISCYSEMGAVVGGCDFKELQDILVEHVQELFKEER